MSMMMSMIMSIVMSIMMITMSSLSMVFSYDLFPWSFPMIFSYDLFLWSFPMIFSHDLFPWSLPMIFSYDLFLWSFPMIFSHDLSPWSFLMNYPNDLFIRVLGLTDIQSCTNAGYTIASKNQLKSCFSYQQSQLNPNFVLDMNNRYNIYDNRYRHLSHRKVIWTGQISNAPLLTLL